MTPVLIQLCWGAGSRALDLLQGFFSGSIAQLVEHQTFNLVVEGSSPSALI